MLPKSLPEVFDPCRHNREAKHLVVVLVETSTGELIIVRTRRLIPEKFRGTPDELNASMTRIFSIIATAPGHSQSYEKNQEWEDFVPTSQT